MTLSPAVVRRQRIEQNIIRAAVKSALAKGYSVSVNDGEEVTLAKSTSEARIMAAIMTTDEDVLLIHDQLKDAVCIGWIKLIYGNDGWDVINDYTTNLEAMLTDAHRVAARYEMRG